MAWLNTAPKDKDGKSGKTRLENIEENEDFANYPPLTMCGYMIGYLFDAGPAMYGGMGASPLSHSEIAAWQENTATPLNAWECRTLKRLSHAYLVMQQQAEAPDCPEPFMPEPEPATQAEVSAKVQSALKLLMTTRPKK